MGRLASSWVAIELFQILAGMGLKASLGRFFPLASEPARRREILTLSLIGNLGGGLLMAAIAWLLFCLPPARGALPFFQSLEPRVFAALIAAAILGNLASTFIIYFRAEQRAGAFLAASLIGAGVEAAALGSLALAGRLSLLNLLLAECLKQAIMMGFIAWQGRRDWGFAFSMAAFKPLLAFGLWFVPVGLGEWFILGSDRFWLGKLGSLDAVGVYGFLYRFSMPLAVLFAGSLMDAHARLYKLEGKAGEGLAGELLERFLSRSGGIASAWGLALPFCLYLASRKLHLFPEIYLAGLPAFPIMAAVVFTLFWGKYYGTVLEYRMRARALMFAQTAIAALSLILIPVSIKLADDMGIGILIGTAFGALWAQLLGTGVLARMTDMEGRAGHIATGWAVLVACLGSAALFAWLL
jgi:O-antigen/teichoic acid export membrane protein